MKLTKTKIVCTIGPACWDEENLHKLINAGMDVARLNFSHGDHQTHRQTFNKIRKIAEELNKPIAIIQDLCGPKIRLGDIPDPGIEIKEGEIIALTGEKIECTNKKFYISYGPLAKDLKPGEPVLIDDGLIQMIVQNIQGNEVLCKVKVGGIVKSKKGVNLPNSSLSISALTEKDIDDVNFGMELGVDFIALSFVRRAQDILKLKKILEEKQKFIPIIAKIEKSEAIQNIDEILTVTDAAMVARGDLGIEYPLEHVPLIQKEIIHKCNRMGKPVITATQMMDSMIRNPIPTRAEVTDIANAILDGTDAVMLSGETASGKYPIEAVKMMDKICNATENELEPKEGMCYPSRNNVVDAISEATCKVAIELNAKGIIVLTDSGRTARQVSRCRPEAPILAVTYTDENQRRLNLSWGVFPQKVEPVNDTDKTLEIAATSALKSNIVHPGNLVVTTAGIPVMVKGSTNMIKVDVLGHVFLRGSGVGPKTKVTGRVLIAHTYEEAKDHIEKDDILIIPRLDDSYIPIASKVAGIVTEEGGKGSYSEYFCEKFNISGIVGVPGAMTKFFPGRIVTIEPERGIIYGAKGSY